ncbi:DUF4249 domain-containing protein [Geofilum sp. OHC36d9]|uniref:DUF4249 domain-containing protein n=1 Tax=Geofilum sp. OHC36d9 TaxID=3458413 RepID=UPI0040349334
MARCESDLTIDMEDGGGELALYSFVMPDSTFSVHLSRSINHSSVDDFERVYDGYVVVYKNDAKIDSFAWPYQSTWAYRSTIKVAQNDKIKIVGGDNQGNLATGLTKIPQPVKIESISAQYADDTDQPEYIDCSVVFTDPADITNYYQLVVISETWNNAAELTYEYNQISYIKSDEDVFYIRDQDGSLLQGIDFMGTFPDDLVKTHEHYPIKIEVPGVYFKSPAPNEKRKLSFLLVSLSEDYYKYLRSKVVAEYNYGLPMLTPVKIHSNISGGHGLVGSLSVASDSIVFIGNNYNESKKTINKK